MNGEITKIYVIKKPTSKDKLVKEALAVSENFRILTYSESYAILEKKLGNIKPITTPKS